MDESPAYPFLPFMIIDSKQGNIEVAGDIKEFKTSIDPKNLEFITTLLSSNLYSDPEQSFIREIVSNAWDSHVEAGTTDVPVIIRFKDTYNEKSITIRDFGTGLSPERFQEVYCMIGSSTKRESNDFHGGFGIGKYSSLACSNTVYISSYYEGTAYYYVMAKSGNQITTNLLNEAPTTEKNGVEVTIRNIKSLEPFNRALQSVVFFPNIYIEGANSGTLINTAKLKRFNNFAAASMTMPVQSKLLLGNVLYKCDRYHFSPDAKDFLSRIEPTGIVIKFDIGELNITPNRENIIYTTDTIKKIEDRIMAAKKELEELIGATYTKDYDNIEEYFISFGTVAFYDPVTGSKTDINTGWNGYKVFPYLMDTCLATYRGLDLRHDLQAIGSILSMSIPNYKGTVEYDKIHTKKLPFRLRNRDTLKTDKLLILNKNTVLRVPVKLYLRENYQGYSLMTDLSVQDFEKYVTENLSPMDVPSEKHIHLIIDGLYESLRAKAVFVNLETDKGFLEFKQGLSADKTADLTKKNKEVILYKWNITGSYKEKKICRNIFQATEYIKSLRKGIVLAEMIEDSTLLGKIAFVKNYTLIQARKEVIREIRKLNLKCVVDTDWLLHKDPIHRVVATLAKHFPDGIDTYSIKQLCANLTKDESTEFNRLVSIYHRYKESSTFYSIVKLNNPPIDSYTEYLCLKLKKYLKEHYKVSAILRESGYMSDDPVMLAAVVMKLKAYKISSYAYNKVKNNKLIKILCKKS